MSETELNDSNNLNLETLDKKGIETLMAIVQSRDRKEAAAKLHISYQALWLRMKKYNIEKVLAEFPKQALQRLQIGSTKAADVLVDALDEKEHKMEAAKEVLDRVGVTGDKPTTLQQFNVTGEMNLELVGPDESTVK